MPTEPLQLAQLLLELGLKYAEKRELEGTPAERAASAAVVVAVMHHAATDVARVLSVQGVSAKVKNTKDGFELHIGDVYVEVERETTGVKLAFCGFGWDKSSRQFLPLERRYQQIPVSPLRFDVAVRLGRAMLRKLVAMLKVAAAP